MRIGIDARSLEGERTGVGRYLSQLLKHWAEQAPSQVAFFLYFSKHIPQDMDAPPNMTPRLLSKFFGRTSNALAVHCALPNAFRKDRIDIGFFPDYVAPLRLRIPFAVTLHDIIFAARPDLYDWPSFIDRVLLGVIAKRAAQQSKIIFVPSEFTRQEIKRVWGLSEHKIIATPLAPDESFIRFGDLSEEKAAPHIRNVKEKYGLTGRYFLFYGTMFQRRKISEMLQAFQEIAGAFPDLSLFLVGKPTPYGRRALSALPEIHRRLNRNAIRWMPHVATDDLPALVRGATGVIYLSEYEGFGLPVIEAMAAGSPVITVSAASLPEVAGDCGLYVKNANNVNEIAQAMRRLLTEKHLRHQFYECGRARAKTFSWERCAQNTLAMLLSL